jgi:hypothetical protein
VDISNSYGPEDRIYKIQVDDDGSTWVQFGDGKRGAQPPSGIDNIKGIYRTRIEANGKLTPKKC